MFFKRFLNILILEKTDLYLQDESTDLNYK